jgi:FMN phosphatase YigB (HAD superfamily)
MFDLDGTLLPVDMEVFLKAYFKELSKKFFEVMHPEKLTETVLTSTEYMINNLEEEKTNMDAFFEDFQKRINVDIRELMPKFNEFYKFDFRKLKNVVNPNPLVKDIIKELKAKGYKLVVATNPVFPKDAILHRIEWAGLNKNDFIYITSYESMHFCKPHLNYYKEILNVINRTPDEVMMVGNDVQEDMVASELGIYTYLIEDYMIDKGYPKYTYTHKGTLNDFYNFVKQLPKINI